MPGNCETCSHWSPDAVPEDPPMGECRIDSPVADLVRVDSAHDGVWPRVAGSRWCARWQTSGGAVVDADVEGGG